MSGPGDKVQHVEGLPEGAIVLGATSSPAQAQPVIEGLPEGATIVGGNDKWAQYEAPTTPTATISAYHPPSTFAGKAEELFHNFGNDIRYGTGNTMAGRILQAMGALGTRRGVSEGAADFMSSPVTGPARALEGSAQWSQPGKRMQGAGNIVGGTLEAGTIPASFASPEISEGVTAAAERLSPGARSVSRLSQLQGKVADIHALVKSAEEAAHQSASAAFPDVRTPVQFTGATGRIVEKTFKEAQEMYSNLGVQIANAKAAVAAGKPAFELERLVELRQSVNDAMTTAARSEGKLQQLNNARAGWKTFEDDFHNFGSAVRPLLRLKSDDTSKIVKQLSNTNNGPKIVETLRKYGADITPIRDLLGPGIDRLNEAVGRAAQLRTLGPDEFKRQQVYQALRKLGRRAGQAATWGAVGGAAGYGGYRVARKLMPHQVSMYDYNK